MSPNQYNLYKGVSGKFGAIQFRLSLPHYYKGKSKDYVGVVDNNNDNDRAAFELVDGRVVLKEGWKQRDGAVFVEAAPPSDKNVYDWSKKITFALSVNDLGKLLYFLQLGKSPNKKERDTNRGGMTLMHDPGAQSSRAGQVRKYLKLFHKEGVSEGVLLTLEQQEKDKDEKLQARIPISGDEIMVLRSLFSTAISKALNW